MSTSPQTTTLSKPVGDEAIRNGVLAYWQSRNKHRAYSLVLSEFKKSGISQATLARRLGKKADLVCRLLGGPGNWTLDTISDLLFAISGGVPKFSVEYPLDKPAKNFGVRDSFETHIEVKKGGSDTTGGKPLEIKFLVGLEGGKAA